MARVISKDIEVSWGDLDALNHVNNAAYLRYMEDTRMAWLGSMEGGIDSHDHSPVVVNININFQREIRYPARLNVRLTITQASEKRIINEYVIADRDDPQLVYAEAELTLVWVSRHTRRSIAVPDFVRHSLEQTELE